MSRKDDRDLERPHYYSQFWINQAREAAGEPVVYSNGESSLLQVMDDREDSMPESILRPAASKPSLSTVFDDFDDLPLPPLPAKPIKQKPVAPPRSSSLSSFADLAALGFGADADETSELAVGADDDTDDIVSRLESEFDMGNVEPDIDEAASLETLSEEEDEMYDEDEDEDENGVPGRTPRTPGKSPRRTPPLPPRRPTREF